MTYDQHIASDPELSVWVSASAGSGKTKVLTDRVLRLLLKGTFPGKILCLTYTKAAAAEMGHRIESRLGHWAVCGTEALQEQLRSLTGKTLDDDSIKHARRLFASVLDAPERIRIQTIHAFCQSVLKRFPIEAEVPPHFTLIDEHKSAELLKEARARLLRLPEDAPCSKAITWLAEKISIHAFDELLNHIIKNRTRFMDGFAKESAIEKHITRLYAQHGWDTSFTHAELFRKHFAYSPEEKQRLRDACGALGQSEASTDSKAARALDAWLRQEHMSLETPPDDYIHIFLKDNLEPRQRLCTKAVEKALPGATEILLREQERLYNFIHGRQSLRLAESSAAMLQLAHAILAIYTELKDMHGYMDHEDSILHTERLLKRQNAAAWVLYKLDEGIDHLLVDEAQDTSPSQWAIVSALVAEFFAGEGARNVKRSLFVVGDGKQSIFSFQGAAPESFSAMRSDLRKRITSSGADFKNVHLALSFRSTEPVLQAVDSVFALPEAQDGLVHEESYLNHAAHRKGMAGRVELWPLTEAPPSEPQENWRAGAEPESATKPEALLAERIAVQIKAWLREKREIASQGRPVEPGDILILVRRRKAFASSMLRSLARHGIPVAGADRLKLTEHIAVMDCMALAEFLLLPQNDLTLAEVLKSPFIGLTEEELFRLAHGRGKTSLWQRLKEDKACEQAHAFLASLLAVVDYMRPYELFAHILEVMEGRKKLAARLGSEINDPLDELLALALQYGDSYLPSLQGFMHWLQSGVTEIKRDMEKQVNAVRIMTAHGAKGLQAPIVFLPDTTQTPTFKTRILWEGEKAFWAPSAAGRDAHYEQLVQALKAEEEREYRRLLYVAMTRAEDELYICGYQGEKSIPTHCWYALVHAAASAGWHKTEDGIFVLSCEQKAPPTLSHAQASTLQTPPLPEWIKRPPPPEPTPSKPLSPSHLDEEEAPEPMVYNETALARGLLIHKLLQHLPDIPPEARPEAEDYFITAYKPILGDAACERIKTEIADILSSPEFTEILSGNSITEAPVSGLIRDAGGKPVTVSGQIDRLTVTPDKVYIIDYKTNAKVPESQSQVHKRHLKQMEAYKQLIKEIYPEKEIVCALLWTAAPKLMLLT